ncbi:DUF6603 domain-containing protein [Sediminispirochaeta bajacaliforniensis]|uniref:DUF6603 domain-containing protein n=1 Tax=Sediminispirochaeta bajacaliforniensis TaxID=148 RepID=UPI0012B6118B|nr:DUF6603 domain-containing protein [Sediminispirochaeta bajacaliforniensis]
MSVFPKEIANGKNLILRLLTIGTSCNLKQIRQFFVTVSVDTDWDFFGLRNLCLKEIELGFYRQTISEKAVNGFTIIGTICISDISVQLGGNYTFEKGWTFTGILLPHEEIHLDEIWISFTDMLDFSGVSSLPIPKISLYDIQIEFNVPDKAFSAKAKSRITSKDSASILEKLFEINAEIRMQSTLKEQKRTCSGQFSGELYIGDSKFTVAYDFDTVSPGNTVAVKWKPVSEKETLSLVKIVKHFGVQDIPQVVSDLDFAISGVEMRYDLDAKELAIQVTSDKFDKIRLTVSDEDYEIDIQLKNALSLSRLPLVGTYLHVLDKVAIENLELFASSKDNQAKETLSGAAFLGSLCEKAFVLQIYHNKAKQEQMLQEPSGASLTKWFAMDKSFGIFELYRLGIGYIDGSITFLLDASLTSKPIGLSLLGIGLGINLSSPGDVSFHLSGIKISYDSGTLAISGSFLKSTLHDAESYDGTLLVKTGDFALFAVGTYSKNAFIVSALINKNFGGPPVFFVTGIAASFAYNMDVNIPVIDSISKFPLVSAAMGNLKKEEMLEKLKDYLRIENGQTFLAAGITFTSFEMIESFALLTFTFGNHTQVNLLGLSQMSIPPHMKRDNDPLAYAQLVLKASFDPKAGLFSVMAKLTSESYILSKKCKLTGGFAFYTWFLREHAGDFVVTLGGYHPLYKRPAHYPDVPRVGFTWDVTSHVNLSGDMYFALTPSVLMAGGRFCALYKKGCVRAWFTVEADFYIAWKPFFYEAKIFACFGVAVKVHILFVHKTIKVELSAGLQIWGPEFSGKAHISLYIISFTIGFGAGASKEPPPLAWTEFRHSFLPQKKSGRVAEQQPEVAFSEDDRALPLSLSLSNGQRGEEQSGSEMVPIVSSTGMELLIKSAVPVTAIELDDTAVPLNKEMPEAGVLPMGEGKRLLSTLSVTCKHAAGQSREWVVEPVYDNLPNAVWGMTKKGDALLKNVAVGLRLYPKEHQTSIFPKTGFIDLNRLSVYSCIERTFTFNPTWQLPPYSQEDAIEEFSGTVMKDEIKHKRHGWIEGLNAAGFDFDFTVDLSKMAEEADNIFSEEMILGVLL